MRAGAASVVGIDEVGRGSLAGPVTVGAVLVLPDTPTAPTGVRDSKDLTAGQREHLEPLIRRWAPVFAIGHASPQEIDTAGIVAALRIAAIRALAGLGRPIGAILLDGSHDWLGRGEGRVAEFPGSGPVATRVKADRHCSSVAAASVLAKVARDRLMADLSRTHGGYQWECNKGYSAPEHLAALAQLGPTPVHRLSWQLPGVTTGDLQRLDPQRIRTLRRMQQGEQLIILDAVRDAEESMA